MTAFRLTLAAVACFALAAYVSLAFLVLAIPLLLLAVVLDEHDAKAERTRQRHRHALVLAREFRSFDVIAEMKRSQRAAALMNTWSRTVLRMGEGLYVAAWKAIASFAGSHR